MFHSAPQGIGAEGAMANITLVSVVVPALALHPLTTPAPQVTKANQHPALQLVQIQLHHLQPLFHHSWPRTLFVC